MRYLFLIFVLLLVACSDDDKELEVLETRMLEISEEVDAIIANKSCNGVDDCASIAWGSKPCGGPWGYLIYSSSNVDVPRLEQLATEYAELQSEVNRIKKLASDCALVEEPELDCADDVCVEKI